jgi:glucose uptake protein
LILPTTAASVYVLCLLLLFALGCWILPWRLGASKLRFEIFAIDFAVGSVLLALVAAFSFGSMGSELAFTDSLLVSGHRAQALVLAAGLIAGFANVALIASASLSGVAPAFVMTGAIGTLTFAWLSDLRHLTHLTIGTILALVSVVLVASVSRFRYPAAPPVRSKKTAKAVNIAGSGAVGVILAILSGFALGAAAELARNGTTGELGVAPYAACVFLVLPALFATVAVTFFLFNFPLQGARLHASNYLGTRVTQHAVGLVAGSIWGTGALACLLVRNAPAELGVTREFGVYSAFGSFALAALCGLTLVSEPERLRARQFMIAAALAVFAVSLYFLSYAIVH